MGKEQDNSEHSSPVVHTPNEKDCGIPFAGHATPEPRAQQKDECVKEAGMWGYANDGCLINLCLLTFHLDAVKAKEEENGPQHKPKHLRVLPRKHKQQQKTCNSTGSSERS